MGITSTAPCMYRHEVQCQWLLINELLNCGGSVLPLQPPHKSKGCENMDYTAKQLVAIAEAEIGYHEKASNSNLDSKTTNSGRGNYTKYSRD